MARQLNKLTEKTVQSRNLKPGRHSDGGGLYLNVTKSGTKSWVFVWKKTGATKRDGSIGTVHHEMGLGAYPTIPLAEARMKADGCRKAVAAGRNPLEDRKKQETRTFGQCADEFIEAMQKSWSNEKHVYQWKQTLGETYCKALRNKPIDEIETSNVLGVLTPIWHTKSETASRLRGRIERVLDYAQVKGWRAGENPARWRGHLRNALPSPKKLYRGRHPAMPYNEVPAFLQRLPALEAMSARALEFLILTAARTGEVLGARWSEFDLEQALWVVPAERMKAREEHRVPLSKRAVEILTGTFRGEAGTRYVFPGGSRTGPLSNMALAMLMRRMKVDAYSVHGFRSAFRDWVGDERHFQERSRRRLWRIVGNDVERAYRRGDAIAKRRKLMQAWCDYCTTKTVRMRKVGNLQVVK